MSHHRNAYLVWGASFATALVLGTAVFAIPQELRAFCVFSCLTTPAAAQGTVVIPDANLRLAQAATNIDPNPHKGSRGIAMSEGSALISEAGPEGTPPDEHPSGSGKISLYTVRSGDTLSDIASMFGVSSNTILWANDLKSSKDIHPGDTLLILPVSGIQHKVQKGETFASLAKKYGADAEEIASFNGADVTATLAAGSTLIIPGGEVKAAPSSSSKQGGGLASVKKNPYKGGSGIELDGYFANPVPGGLITQGVHGWNGIDIGAKSGTPIYASASGKVIVSRTGGWNGGYGNYVVITHDNGTQTLYSHMSGVTASMGASVSKGELIGYVGKTGEATGFHLHFEVRGAKNPFAACAVGKACAPH